MCIFAPWVTDSCCFAWRVSVHFLLLLCVYFPKQHLKVNKLACKPNFCCSPADNSCEEGRNPFRHIPVFAHPDCWPFLVRERMCGTMSRFWEEVFSVLFVRPSPLTSVAAFCPKKTQQMSCFFEEAQCEGQSPPETHLAAAQSPPGPRGSCSSSSCCLQLLFALAGMPEQSKLLIYCCFRQIRASVINVNFVSRSPVVCCLWFWNRS